MNLLHPWAIAVGAAAVALPFVIHWLTRPRPRRLPLSTIRFVMEVVQQRRARYRLRDLLVLLLRAAAVLLLAWAFARPLIGEKPLIAVGEPGDAVRVVILDQSQSMAAVSHGLTPFERGRTLAAEYIEYRSGLRGNLILAGARPRATFEQISSNFGAMREQLASAAPRPERLDLAAAIQLAGQMLAQAGAEQRRELVIISDFQRSTWVSADFSALPQETLIQLESVGFAETPANVGILRVGAQGRLEQGREVRLEVEVGNYSPIARQVEVEVTLGQQVYRLEGLCPPGVKTTLAGEVPLREGGWQIGEARLVGMSDALAADDSRAFVIEVRPSPTYGLVTRESPRPQASSSHFLERALVPGSASRVQGSEESSGLNPEPRTLNPETERVIRIDPVNLDREALAGVGLIVLDRPGKLSESQINLLAGLLRRGRGVLYVAAEPVDAVNLKLLEESAGRDLRLPVEFMPPGAQQTRRDLFLVEWQANELPFSEFGDSLPAVLNPLRFSGGLNTRRVESGLIDDVLATYSDRSACLVVTSCGLGTLAVLNADLTESNLARTAAFVPLVGELVGRLLAARRGEESAGCGEPVAMYLPMESTIAGLTVRGPRRGRGLEGEVYGELTEEGQFVLWRWGAAGEPGVYEVKRDGATVFALATAVPGVESDLATIDPSVLTTRLAGGRKVHYQSAGGEERQKDDVWAWVLLLCAMCVVGEVVVLRAFRT